MKDTDFKRASKDEFQKFIARPYEEVPITLIADGAKSHLVCGKSMMYSFLTMKAGSVFELHSHPEEQIMFVLEGYCDEIIEDKLYRVKAGDLIYLPSNIIHGAFLREVDCRVLDVFSPLRNDYRSKFIKQNPEHQLLFP